MPPWRRKEKKDSGINYRSDEVEGRTFTEFERGNKTNGEVGRLWGWGGGVGGVQGCGGGWGRGVKSAAAECWHPTNGGRVQQVPGRH